MYPQIAVNLSYLRFVEYRAYTVRVNHLGNRLLQNYCNSLSMLSIGILVALGILVKIVLMHVMPALSYYVKLR